MKRARPLLVAGALAASTLAGCGIGSQEVRTVTAPAPSEDASTPAPGTAAEDDAAATPAPSDGPLVEGTGSDNGQPFSVAILELKRSGPTVVLNGQVSVPYDEEVPNANFQITDTFSDPAIDTAEGVSYDAFDGVALIDPQNRKKYLVARDADGECVCTRELSSAFARPDAPISVQATLTAPPPEVKFVDLYVPKVQTFTKVPVADE